VVSRRGARLSDVARLAEVSPGLVSRIVNDDPTLKVRAATRERVLEAVEMLQYIPHASARALRSSRTGLLGFALHRVNDPIYSQLVDSAQAAATARGYSVVLLSAEDLMGRPSAHRALVRGHRVDGLLIQSGFSAVDARLQDVAREVPSLVFNADETPGLRTLRLDDAAAARTATRHLMDLGHRRIAFVGAEGATSRRRFQGYAAALADGGIAPMPMIAGGWEAESARAEIESYLAAGGDATGLVVASSTSALGVHAGVLSSGAAIPQEISVVSIHDTWFAEHLTPSLTVVQLPLADIGSTAVDLLIEQIEESTEGEIVLDEQAPRLIQRASSASPSER
jgi:LacI family transcriptional regulator